MSSSRFIFFLLTSCTAEVRNLLINLRMVGAFINAGDGYADYEQCAAMLNMHPMTRKTWETYAQYFGGAAVAHTRESMALALQQKKKFTVASGAVIDQDGRVELTVACDGT